MATRNPKVNPPGMVLKPWKKSWDINYKPQLVLKMSDFWLPSTVHLLDLKKFQSIWEPPWAPERLTKFAPWKMLEEDPFPIWVSVTFQWRLLFFLRRGKVTETWIFQIFF